MRFILSHISTSYPREVIEHLSLPSLRTHLDGFDSNIGTTSFKHELSHILSLLNPPMLETTSMSQQSSHEMPLTHPFVYSNHRAFVLLILKINDTNFFSTVINPSAQQDLILNTTTSNDLFSLFSCLLEPETEPAAPSQCVFPKQQASSSHFFALA